MNNSRLESNRLSVAAHFLGDEANSIAWGVIVLDHQWRIAFVNQIAVHFLNRSVPEELIGLAFLKVLPGSSGRDLQKIGKRALREETPAAVQLHSEEKGEWFEYRFYPIPNSLIILFVEIPPPEHSAGPGAGDDRDRLQELAKPDPILADRINPAGGDAASQRHPNTSGHADAQPERATNVLIALNAAAQKLQQQFSPEQLAQEIIEILDSSLGYTNSAVLLIDERDGETMLPFALSTQSQGAEFLRKDKQFVTSKKPRVGVGITGWVAQHGKSLRVGNVLEDPRYFSMRVDIRSELCVPICSNDRVIGVINVESTKENAYSYDDQLVLETVAAQISVSIQRAQFFEKLRQEFADHEQMRAMFAQSVKNPALGRLTATLAHEINNPLQSIKGFLSLYHQEVMEGQSQEKLEQYFKIVNDELARITRLIRNMRDFYRPAAKGFLQVDINALIQNVLELTEEQFRDHGIDVIPSLAKSLPPVTANADQIKQLVLNLVLNAIDAMDAGGSFFVSTSVVKPNADRILPMLAIKMTDTGHGMSQYVLDHLFDPFFTTKENGTGLGMYICQEIVELHGGKIMVSSKINGGTTFRVLLPVYRKENAL